MSAWTSPEGIGLFVAGVLTLIVFSYLAGDNPAYRVTQHLFVGLTAGYVFVVAYHHVLLPKVVLPVRGAVEQGSAPPFMVVLAALFGVLMLLRLARPTSWLATFPIGLVVGAGAALALIGAIAGTLIPQSLATADTLWRVDASVGDLIGQWVIVVGVIAVLTSFSVFGFSAARDSTGPVVVALRRSGRWLLMLSLGALFASVAASRFALLADRVSFLAGDWLLVISGGL